MNKFFTESENESDFNSQNNSQTTVNSEVLDTKTQITDFEFNENESGFGSNYNSLINHFNTEKEIGQENPNFKKKESEESEKKIENSDGKKDGENQESTTENSEKHTPEYYEQTGKFIAEMENIFIPKGIALLNGERGENQSGIPYANKYKAEKKLVDELGKSWARYLEEKQVHLSPGQQLVWVHIVAYGLPLGMAGINYFKRLQIQKQENQMQLIKTMQSIQNGTTQSTVQDRAETKPVEAEQQTPLNNSETVKKATPPKRFFVADQDKQVKEIIETPERIEIENNPFNYDNKILENIKICQHHECEKSFIEGEGYAKTKGTKNYDKYCSKSCMYNDVNKQNYMKTKRAKKIDNANS